MMGVMSMLRARAHSAQLRCTELMELIRMPSMSKSSPRVRIFIVCRFPLL